MNPIANSHTDTKTNYNNNNTNTNNDQIPPSPPSSPGPYTSTTYARRPEHTAHTSSPATETSYILTLRTDPAHHRALTDLRTRYFPSHLNKLSAHVALFRALPGSHLHTITADIHTLALQQRPFPIRTGHPFYLGRRPRGVAVGVIATQAGVLYEELKEKWGSFLSSQDKSFRPHYTIQNKVEEDVAVRTREELESGFEGSKGWVDGVVLWRYESGFWRREEDFMFGT